MVKQLAQNVIQLIRQNLDKKILKLAHTEVYVFKTFLLVICNFGKHYLSFIRQEINDLIDTFSLCLG